MIKNIGASLLYATAFIGLFLSLIMQHLIFTGGVIAESFTQEFRYNFNFYATMGSVILMVAANRWVRHGKKYYEWFIFGNNMVIGLCVMHILALAFKTIYDPWYIKLTGIAMLAIALLFLRPLRDAYHKRKESEY